MRRAIRAHRLDFAALAVLVVAAVVVVAYVLRHQPAFNFGQSYYTINAEFSDASAVTSGQGQAVTIAGVQVGQIGAVKLSDGHAVVTMDIYKRDAPIYRNATVLLRPRTPLKDMYLALDPGDRSAGAMASGSTLPVSQTNPDVDVSEILSSLDSDTRNYLVLLLAGGAGLFKDSGSGQGGARPSARAVSDLQQTLKRFAPLNQGTRAFASLLARRQANLRRAIHNLDRVAGSLGGVDRQLASLVSASDQSFAAVAANDSQLRAALSQLPATLRQTSSSLGKVATFSSASATTLHRLAPFAHNLAPALKAARPLVRDTTPVIARQLRPFSVAVQPLARTLRPASAALNTAVPKLNGSVSVLNSLFNELAYQPRGGAQSYLFYGAWLAHIADSLASSQDANGAVLQGIFMGTCAQLNFYENQLQVNNQPLGVILDLLGAPPVAQLPGVSKLAGTDIYTCPS